MVVAVDPPLLGRNPLGTHVTCRGRSILDEQLSRVNTFDNLIIIDKKNICYYSILGLVIYLEIQNSVKQTATIEF